MKTTTTKSLSGMNLATVLAAARNLYGAAMPDGCTAVATYHSHRSPRASWVGVRVLRPDGTMLTETGIDDTYFRGIDVNDHTVKAAVVTFVETMQADVDANARAAR